MTTIVSAFIYLENNKNRSLEKYIEYGFKLLKLDQNKIIFIDEKVFEHFENFQNENTILIKIKFEDLYLYKYKSLLNNWKINTDNPTKDTLDYMITICHKSEWVKEAIELNKFSSEQYLWLDFGIYHMIKDMPNKFNIYNKVRISKVWDLNKEYNKDIFKDVNWYFAGTVFGGDKDKLILFAELVKNKCEHLIKNDKHLMWEVNVWYLVWKENKDIFDPYFSDHNQSVINNY